LASKRPRLFLFDGVLVDKRPRLALLKVACQYGGFGRVKAYELIHEGKIDAYKMDHRTMIDLDSIDRYHDSLPKLTLRPQPA
jgi:hypothetical protein